MTIDGSHPVSLDIRHGAFTTVLPEGFGVDDVRPAESGDEAIALAQGAPVVVIVGRDLAG